MQMVSFLRWMTSWLNIITLWPFGDSRALIQLLRRYVSLLVPYLFSKCPVIIATLFYLPRISASPLLLLNIRRDPSCLCQDDDNFSCRWLFVHLWTRRDPALRPSVHVSHATLSIWLFSYINCSRSHSSTPLENFFSSKGNPDYPEASKQAKLATRDFIDLTVTFKSASVCLRARKFFWPFCKYLLRLGITWNTLSYY